MNISMPISFGPLRNAMENYQALVNTYEVDSEALEQNCETQLASTLSSTDSDLAQTLLTRLVNQLDAQSADKATMVILRQNFLDSRGQFCPPANYAWHNLYAMVMEKLDDSNNEADRVALFSSIEQLKQDNATSFERVDSVHMALEALDRSINQLDPLTLNENAIAMVTQWQQFRDIAAPFMQQQQALTETLRAAFSSLIPILNGSLVLTRVEAANEGGVTRTSPSGGIAAGQNTHASPQNFTGDHSLNTAEPPRFKNNN